MKKLSLAALGLVFGLSAAEAQEPLYIVVAAPASGAQASDGKDMKAGAVAAAKDINAQGGVLGRSIEILTEDDAGSPVQAKSTANKIVSEGRHYVIGHYNSADTKPASAEYAEAGIVHITPSQNAALMQQNFERFFRINPNSDMLAKAYYDLVLASAAHGNPRIALIGSQSELSENISSKIISLLSERSINIAYKGHYAPNDKDYAAIITRMKSEKISLVLITGSQQEMGNIVRQSADHGFHPQFALSSTAASAGFAGIVQCAGEGVKVVAARNPLYFPGNEKIREAIIAADADGLDMAINTYSAVKLLADAITKAGVDDPAKVSDILHKESFDLPLGRIRFTTTGEFVGPAPIVYQYQGVNCPNGSIQMRPAPF